MNFDDARQQLISKYLDERYKIESRLENENLSPEERTQLEERFKEVQDMLNKLNS